jgi:hypothetical protein
LLTKGWETPQIAPSSRSLKCPNSARAISAARLLSALDRRKPCLWFAPRAKRRASLRPPCRTSARTCLSFARRGFEPVEAVRQNQNAVILEHDNGRNAVAPEHGCGIFRDRHVVDMGAGLGPSVCAEGIQPELSQPGVAIVFRFGFIDLSRDLAR